jgi:hypothetical protein
MELVRGLIARALLALLARLDSPAPGGCRACARDNVRLHEYAMPGRYCWACVEASSPADPATRIS